jgi:hypothetical protein
MARTGNRMFNAQIVMIGPMMIKKITARIANVNIPAPTLYFLMIFLQLSYLSQLPLDGLVLAFGSRG